MRKRAILIVSLLFIIGIIIAILLYHGVVLLNNPSKENYPVRGIDVSSYQGDIDWNVLSAQGIQFAFIKATEGSSFVDSNYQVNFQNAKRTNLRVGAYHFFSYDSSGETQAANFISQVKQTEDMLPPVVDIEFYGDKKSNLPDVKTTQTELTILLDKLEQTYGVKPIIYATQKSYQLYIDNEFDNYDIWIRNVITKPKLSDKREWTFWQYTNRERLEGYNGKERFIDVNVFRGTQSEFDSYGR